MNKAILINTIRSKSRSHNFAKYNKKPSGQVIGSRVVNSIQYLLESFRGFFKSSTSKLSNDIVY